MFIASSGSWEVVLDAGATYVVGRTGGEPDPDLPLGGDERLHRRCATLTVESGGVTIANVGSWLPVTITDVDGAGELRVDPATQLAVPFRSFVLSVDLGDEQFTIRVESEDPEYLQIEPDGSDDAGEVGGTSTTAMASVSRRAGYYKALVLLCEPKLRDATSEVVPTDQQIASRLNQLGLEPKRVSADIVERRLAYCRERLGLRSSITGVGAEDRNARRRLLTFAINHRIVTRSDLDRLDPGAS